jgi:hypothetical protein
MTMRPRGYRHRALAAAVSIAATLGLLSAIGTPSPSTWTSKPVSRPAIEVRLLAATPPVADRATPPTPKPTPGWLTARPKRESALPLPISAPPPEPSITVRTAPAPAEQPPEGATAPASAPLKLDAATLRAAAGQSKGQVHRMAEASGQDTGGNAASQSDRLGTSVKNAAKPDCTTVGASSGLFALPVIAYALIKDQCR